MRPPVYLDCAATTPIDPRVLEEVVRCLGAEHGNAGSRTHAFGTRARRAVEQARDQIAQATRATRGEVVFTSGATESNNLAILGLAEHGRLTGRRHMVSTQIEHRSVLEPLQALLRQDFQVTFVPPTPGGWVEPEAIRGALREDTLLVSVMQVNNETGVRQPIDAIAKVLGDHPAFFHIDAAQGFGKENPPLWNPRLDLISISGHKIHAPQGIGALVARRRDGKRPPLAGLTFGGGQELGLRPGTLPVALIAGLGRAVHCAIENAEARLDQCRAFRDRALRALAPLNPRVNGDSTRTVPHILNLSFPGLLSDEVIEATQDLVAISSGAACTSQSETCSHVLAAQGIDAERAAGALRFSWCHLTKEPNWPRFVEVVRQLRDG